MSRKRKPTVDDLYDSKQRGATTLDQLAIIEAAQKAVTTLINIMEGAFENWVTIGRAVVLAREIADREGGGKTFKRLLEDWKLAEVVNPSTASTLERIMRELPAVQSWRDTLTKRQRIDWAAPTTILKHCPVFKKQSPAPDQEKPLSKAEQTNIALAAALEENAKLKAQKEDERFTPTDTVEDVAVAIVGMFSPRKAKAIADRVYSLLKKRAAAKLDAPADQPETMTIYVRDAQS